MKTKEFIKKINDLGYYAKLKDYDEKILYICHNNKGDVLQHILAAVNIEQIGVINTFYNEFNQLNIDKQQQLLGLLSKYSRTPIKERNEEKKYMYRLREINNLIFEKHSRGDYYLNYNTKRGRCFLHNNEEGSDIKTKFTHSWLEEQGIDIEQLKEIYEELEVKE